jgi:hypothetical protein
MKRQILFTVLTFISFQIFGQQKSIYFDTLIVVVNESITVRISSYENGWLKYYDGFKTKVDKFKEDLSKIQNEIPKNPNLTMISKKTGEITIETTEDLKKYRIEDEISKTRENKVYILSDKYDILIYFNELDDIFTTDIQECLNRAVDNQAKYLENGGWVDYTEGKFHGIAWTDACKCENDTILFIREKSHYNANKSQLSIKVGAGAGIIKNQLTTDFTFGIGKFQTRKGILKHHIYISDNMHYMFSQTDNIQINNFLNLGYRFNLSNRLDKSDWIGFELGYLTNSNGDFFKTPTFRFGTMMDLKHNITLSPQIYFEDGFKKVYPGIRIGIDLGL